MIRIKYWAALLAAVVLLFLPGLSACASEEDSLLLPAVVTAGSDLVIQAPISGALAPFTLRAGDSVKSGDTLFTLLPQEVYADIDGTVAAVYAQDGDIADGRSAVTARCCK